MDRIGGGATAASRRRAGGAAACALALACCGPARSAGLDVGLGGGPARGRVDCVSGEVCDRSGGFGRLTATWRLDSDVELGASYVHAGSFKGRDVTSGGTLYGGDFTTDAIGLTAGYGWRFAPRWRLSGRAGVAAVRTHFDYDPPFSGSADKTTLQPLAGVGLAYAFTPQLSVAIDYDETRFKVHQSHGPLRLPGVSLHYSF